jgi:hypothetical protein
LSYVINHLSFRIGEKITMERVKVKPLLMVPQDDLRIRANGTDQRIEATVAEALCGTASRHSGGDPLLKVERAVYDIKGKPEEYVSALYRADKYFFDGKLKRKRSKDSMGFLKHYYCSKLKIKEARCENSIPRFVILISSDCS